MQYYYGVNIKSGSGNVNVNCGSGSVNITGMVQVGENLSGHTVRFHGNGDSKTLECCSCC